MEQFNVAELSYDPWGWHAEAGRWADSYGDVVVAFETNQRVRMAEACSLFFSAVANRDLAHDGDPRIARHLAHVVAKETAGGIVITKERRSSRRVIDLAVACVGAHARAYWHHANHEQAPEVWAAFAQL